ncbi:hypothetical protein JTL79_35700, partial [Pseudomonas aeruginosa]|nr:hypothetical protein [Pseudomonas aeruginosa]
HRRRGDIRRVPRQIHTAAHVVESLALHLLLQLAGEFRITANQNLIVASVPEDQKARIEKLARDHGLMNAVTPQRENSMACVSFPTCPLAMAEAERFLPSFIDKVEGVM